MNRATILSGITDQGGPMTTSFRTVFGMGVVVLLATAGGLGGLGCTGAVPPAVTGTGATGGPGMGGQGTGGAGAGGPGMGGSGTGAGNGANGSGGSIVSGGGAPGPCVADASLAPARIWRITDQQYVNVVAQVFGVRIPIEVTEADTHPADYTNTSESPSLTVQLSVATAYQAAARNAAQAAVAVNLPVFLPCGQVVPTDACVERFIRNRVARAFGRPVTDGEVQDLLALYHTGLADNVSVGMRLIIEAVLQAPSFLYRTEIGGSATAAVKKVTMSPFEVAGALSFALLDSVPDDALWQKAQDGSLMTPSVLASEVDRLLASPNVQANLGSKASFWLGVEKLYSIVPKNTTLFPEFTADLKQTLYDSARMFVSDLFAHGTVADLLSSKRMYVNAALAKVYGIPNVTSTTLIPMDLQLPERSAGILTQPAVLAAWARPNRGDPIHRGLLIYDTFVCGSPIPAPPANAIAVSMTFPADATERELSNLRTTSPMGCGACHGLFDPLGLSTEKYDPIGRYVPVDGAGKAVDSSSTIARLGPDLDGPISDLPDLVAKLKTGRRVADCASRNLAVFVLGRSVVGDQSCAFQQVKDRFAASGSFMDYYRAMLTSPAFVTRDVTP